MTIISSWPGPEKRIVLGKCPNMGHACNCIGACQPIVVDVSDERSDDEIRKERDDARRFPR